MRTTVTLDDDVAALIESERARTGESFRDAINRLLRRSARQPGSTETPLPLLPGRAVLDVSDVSTVLAALDEQREMPTGA
jgi:negative regulator of replication initiation